MKRKLLSSVLSVAMVAALLTGCGAAAETTEEVPATEEAATTEEAPAADTSTADGAEAGDTEQTGAGKTVALCMPTQSSERWINDCANMKSQLEAKGYTVIDQFAEDDVQQQVSQVENMVAQGVDCLVIAAVDSGALTTVEASAKEANIPIIAYDRLLMDTDAVSYYATFDNKGVGTVIGETIKAKADLDNVTADDPKTIEFFMGSPDDNNALMLYNGLMEVLQPYLDDGRLVCKSGRTSFDDTCILRWSQETAQQNAENYLASFYADEDLDIAASAFDGFSYGIKAALESAGYTQENWPIISGQDAELMACKNIIAGSQTFSIYKDTRLLASKAVTMVDAVCNGTEPEINDSEQYNNNVVTVPSYLCTPVAVDSDNLQEIIVDGGYYTQDQLDN